MCKWGDTEELTEGWLTNLQAGQEQGQVQQSCHHLWGQEGWGEGVQQERQWWKGEWSLGEKKGHLRGAVTFSQGPWLLASGNYTGRAPGNKYPDRACLSLSSQFLAIHRKPACIGGVPTVQPGSLAGQQARWRRGENRWESHKEFTTQHVRCSRNEHSIHRRCCPHPRSSPGTEGSALVTRRLNRNWEPDALVINVSHRPVTTAVGWTIPQAAPWIHQVDLPSSPWRCPSFGNNDLWQVAGGC